MIITVQETIAGPIPVSGILASLRRVALAVTSVLVTASTLTAFGESYRALYLWALHHGVPFGWALVWPLMIDVFIAVGELALFVGMVDHWSVRARILPWCVTLGGIAASIAANVGHVSSHVITDQLTASVPPLAAAVSLAVAMAVLKRVVRHRHQAVSTAATDGPEIVPAALTAPVPGTETIVSQLAAESVPGTMPYPRPAPVLDTVPTPPVPEPVEAVAGTVPEVPKAVAPKRARSRAPKRGSKSAPENVAERAQDKWGEEVISGSPVPSLRTVMSELNLGQPKAREAREHLQRLVPAFVHTNGNGHGEAL